MNYNISPAHFVAIVEKLKPTNDFAKDAKILMDIGDLLCKVVNYQKWASVQGLTEEVVATITKHFSHVELNLDHIRGILAEAKDKMECPSSTDLKITDYMKDTFSKQIGFTYDLRDINIGRTYTSFIDNLYIFIAGIYTNYKSLWNSIEDSYEPVNDHIVNIYAYLEDIDEVKVMDTIDEKIKQVIDININHGYYKDEDELAEDVFKKYEDELANSGLDSHAQQVIMDGNVKTQIAFYRLSWKLSETQNIMKNSLANYHEA
jgi:hypothetical protein